MMLLVNCSNCHTPLQLPPGATSIRCAICQAITYLTTQPSLYNHVQPASAHGQKRAVIIGISYKYSKNELKGCINDAKNMKYLLTNKFKFPESSILMLTEEETDPYKIPTKYNMRLALYWLVLGCQPGDSLVFHYSGHGSRQINYSGDEVDGYDETLCPLDYKTQGMIVDDEINATIVRPLPRGVKLHAILDSCYSGTILDLPFLCRMSQSGHYSWEDHRPKSGVWKGSNGGEVFCISACDDHQKSDDTTVLSKVASTGVMTFCFIQAIERGHASTYGSLLSSMRNVIRNPTGRGYKKGGDGVATSLLALLTGGSLDSELSQEPQLTVCEPFDVYAKPFFL
ncbi:metacaspase-1-like [Bidens hawaiensis]|uniref:metacaspase-1-like n=1 Tax=Bidens hawaiensis TaxID=980011 RepID=UPI00404B53C2